MLRWICPQVFLSNLEIKVNDMVAGSVSAMARCVAGGKSNPRSVECTPTGLRQLEILTLRLNSQHLSTSDIGNCSRAGLKDLAPNPGFIQDYYGTE